MAGDRELKRLTDEHQKRHQRFQANYKEKTDLLLVSLLPSVEASTLQKLSEAGIALGSELLKKIEEDRERCESELVSLEEQLSSEVSPAKSEVAEDLEKLRGHYDALQPFLKKCFEHPRFDELLVEGYGTKTYPKRIWHLSYYLDRRAAKEIREICDGRSYKSIRQEAIQALEASSVLKERIQSLKARKRAIAAIARRQKKLQDRLESHQQIWLASARRKLRDLLESDPVDALEKCRILCAEESFEWRLASELCKEHWDLEVRFLGPAREALKNGLKATCQGILEEYETLAEAMKRFDQPTAPKEEIDWKAFIFKEPESEE